jgi:bifunctional polynucleotide phosphatase/kinase
MNPEKRTILPSQAFKGFSSRYQRPALSEGFQDITEMEFKVGRLTRALMRILYLLGTLQFAGNEAERQIWTRHWT